MADAHRHLRHQVMAVVDHQAEQGQLLGPSQQPEERTQGIAQAVEAEIGPAGPHVADQIAAAVIQPLLQPVGNHLRLHVELIARLVVAVLLGGPAAQHLHRLAGHPVVVEQVNAQIPHPGAGEFQALLDQGAAMAAPFHQAH